MAFDGLKNFAGMMNFKASSIGTKWDEIKTSDHFDEYPNYDYFPIMKDGSLVGMAIRDQYESKREVIFKETKLFLDEEADILDAIDRLKTNYKNNVGTDKPSFLILGRKEKPSRMLTFADLNCEEVSALIWRIIKNIEIILKKAIDEITYDMMVNSLGQERADRIKRWVENDQDGRVELGFVNYLSLKDIKKILEKQRNDFPDIYDVAKEHLTADVIKLRNNVSHHRVGKSLVSHREDIYNLHRTLKDLEYLNRNIG